MALGRKYGRVLVNNVRYSSTMLDKVDCDRFVATTFDLNIPTADAETVLYVDFLTFFTGLAVKFANLAIMRRLFCFAIAVKRFFSF